MPGPDGGTVQATVSVFESKTTIDRAYCNIVFRAYCNIVFRLYWMNFLKGRVTPSEPISHCGVVSRLSKVVMQPLTATV